MRTKEQTTLSLPYFWLDFFSVCVSVVVRHRTVLTKTPTRKVNHNAICMCSMPTITNTSFNVYNAIYQYLLLIIVDVFWSANICFHWNELWISSFQIYLLALWLFPRNEHFSFFIDIMFLHVCCGYWSSCIAHNWSIKSKFEKGVQILEIMNYKSEYCQQTAVVWRTNTNKKNMVLSLQLVYC